MDVENGDPQDLKEFIKFLEDPFHNGAYAGDADCALVSGGYFAGHSSWYAGDSFDRLTPKTLCTSLSSANRWPVPSGPAEILSGVRRAASVNPIEALRSE